MPTPSQSQPEDAPFPLVIRPQGGAFWCRVFGVLFSLVAPVGLWWAVPSRVLTDSPWLIWGVAGLMLLLGLDQLAGLANRIIIEPGYVEKRSVWGVNRLAVADLAGYRADPAEDGCIVLEPRKHGLLRISIPVKVLARHPAYADWLAQLENLDAAEFEAAQADIEQDPAFGATVEQRNARLTQLRRLCWLLNFTGVAVTGWAIVWPEPYWIAVLAAAACPALAVLASLLKPAWFRLLTDENSPAPNLMGLLLPPAGALAFRAAEDVQLVRAWPAVAAAAVAGGALVALLQALKPGKPAPWRERLMLWLIASVPAAAYAFGVLVLANVHFDSAAPERTPQRVERMTAAAHEGAFELSLAPWSAQHGTVEVGGRFYRSVQAGGGVCIDRYRGALGLGWWRVTHCPDGGAAKR